MLAADLAGVWIFSEHEAGELTRVTREVLSEGRRLADKMGCDLVAVLAGHDVSSLSAAAGEFGADTTLLIDHPILEWYSVLPYCAALTGAIEQHKPSIVLFGATPLGNDLAPRMAARLRRGLVCDCNLVEVSTDGTLLASKLTYGGKASAAYRFTSGTPHILTLIPGATEIREAAREPQVISWGSPSMAEPIVTRIGVLEADPETVPLSEAQVIVAAGRGMGSREGFSVVEELARTLRASVGGTRVAVDNGWIPFERQIGQTGKSVAPRFLMSLGTSGAAPYTQGFRDAEYVLAVDKNPQSAIFDAADMGVVADVQMLLPVLIDMLKSGYRASSEGQVATSDE